MEDLKTIEHNKLTKSNDLNAKDLRSKKKKLMSKTFKENNVKTKW